jgi:hypothetical protein
MTDKTHFREAVETALSCAKRTGKAYFILFPFIINKELLRFEASDSLVRMVVPVVHKSYLRPEEADNVAFTVYPSGTIRWGNTIKRTKTTNKELQQGKEA